MLYIGRKEKKKKGRRKEKNRKENETMGRN
jgi:hypothetical protein